jgi:predicted DNA-binding transcriptional regulator AlpA
MNEQQTVEGLPGGAQQTRGRGRLTYRRPSVPEPRRRALTPAETAAQLGLSVQQLAALRHRGDGPLFMVLSARSIRYDVASVDEWKQRSSAPYFSAESVSTNNIDGTRIQR